MKKQKSLITTKPKCTAPLIDQNINQGQSSIKTVREKLKPKLSIFNTPIKQVIRTQNKTQSLKDPKRNTLPPRKKFSKSHINNQQSEINLLIKSYRKDMRCSETIVIDTRGNNNLNTSPDKIQSINKDQFERLILKGIREVSDKSNSLFLTDMTIFNDKERSEIDRIIPLEIFSNEKEPTLTSDNLSLKSFDELTDLPDDIGEDDRIGISSMSTSSSPLSLTFTNKQLTQND